MGWRRQATRACSPYRVPAQAGADGPITADISTAFSGWAAPPDGAWTQLWRDPTLILTQPSAVTGISPQAAQGAGMTLGVTLLVLGLLILLLIHRHRWAVRAAVYGFIIVSMVITPLLQTQQVSAFYDGQQARVQAAAAANGEPAEEKSAFNPHENPVAVANTSSQGSNLAAAPAAPAAAPNSATALQITATCTVTDSSDCDGDGLSDQIEIHQLGTLVDDVDTDGDNISDYMEVQGFTIGGQTWYLDPRSSDSNGDGLLDTIECLLRSNMNEDGSIDSQVEVTDCLDTDADGTPDVYDFDNDGDGVPDSADIAPFVAQEVTNSEFGLSLSGYQESKSLEVTIQVRPTDDRHLWWTNSYLDWPDNDLEGQVQRVTANTIASDVDADMLLSPVLEIELPYSADNPSRGLPVLDGVDATTITKTMPISMWVDSAVLLPYAITVGEPNPDDGALFVYVPLTNVEDSVGDSPVALTGSMRYEMPATASGWGGNHTVRLAWLVNGLNDSCTVPEGESDDYCNDHANWTSEQTLLQSYYDDFTITGLQVEESHGGSAAVFAQTSNSGAYEPDLWHLADVLQKTFLEHAIDPTTNQRLAVGNIDNHLNAWGVDSLYVKEVNASTEIELMDALTGDEVLTMLSEAQPSAALDESANLLFALETSARTATLGMTDVTFANNIVSLDLANSDLVTKGTLRWNPYIYTGSGWTVQTVASESETDTTVDRLESAFESLFTDQTLNTLLDETVDDYTSVRQGAAALAVSYYIAHYMPSEGILESPDLSSGELFADKDYAKSGDPATDIVSRLVNIIQRYYMQISLSNLDIATSDAAIEGVANNTWASLASSSTAVLRGYGDLQSGESSTLAIALRELDNFADPEDVAGLTEGHALRVSATIVTVYNEGMATLHFAAAVTRAWILIVPAYKVWEATQHISEVRAGYKYVPELYIPVNPPYAEVVLARSQANLSKYGPEFVKTAKIGLAVELTLIAVEFAWTVASEDIPLDSVEFNRLIAETVASIIVAVVEFAIVLSNPGTAIVFVLVHILDAIIAVICAVADPNGKERQKDATIQDATIRYACKGFAGLITEALTYVLNDTTLLMDLERETQFDVVFESPTITVADKASGFAVGNTLTLSATITANAYTGHPNWMGYIWNWQLRDENVKETAVDFRLQASQTDFDGGLHFGDTAWQRPEQYRIVTDAAGTPTNPQPGKRFETDFQRSVDYTLPDAGVNVGLSDVYFSEAVRVKKQDCWLVVLAFYPVPFCGTDEVFDDTFHQSLEETFVFDVFPATLSDFHALAQDVDGEPGIRLAWDDAFPVLRDADGDGLVSKAFNGPDPDDSNPDTDGDGLSDFYEYQNGFDATDADGDCDGLTDYWEAFYNTDPNHSDSDYDGLTDGREVFHPNLRYPYENSVLTNTNAPTCAAENGLTGGYAGGWSTVYAFNGDTPLHFWVSSDPNDADSDDDGLTDRSEQVYGYNPHAPSELDVLALETEISTSRGVGPYVATGDSINYAATITNDLSDRYLRGLLESELPVDHVIKTQEVDGLLPLASTTLAGSVTVAAAGLSASTATSMTLRSGVIVDEVPDHLLWLRFNEQAGATTFADSSVFGHDATGSNVTANGEYLSLPTVNAGVAASGIEIPAGVNGLTIAVWFKLTATSTGQIQWLAITEQAGPLMYVGEDGLLHAFIIEGSPKILSSTATVSANEWHHAAATFNGSAGHLYLDGQLVASGASGPLPSQPLTFSVGGNGGAAFHPIYLDNAELISRSLSESEIRDSYGREIARFDLTGAGNGVSCDGDRCPTLSNDGATFNQTQHLTLDTSGLSFSNNQFSIAVNVKPQPRAHPFDIAGRNQFGRDLDHDWQAVYGYEDPNNSKRIFPSLFVGDNGALRVDMGDGTNSCSYETSAGIVAFGAEQHVTVSFDGSTFTIYINGEERASGAPPACGGIQIPNSDSLFVGAPSANDYLNISSATFTKLDDNTTDAKAEVRLNVNDDGSGGNVWSGSVDTINPPYTGNGRDSVSVLFNYGAVLKTGDKYWFRLWEDDRGDSNAYNGNDSNPLNNDDDSILQVSNITFTSLGSVGTTFDNSDGTGTIYWGLSNDHFVGTLRNLSLFNYALSPQGAERTYNTETFALQMDFDEAPGETTLTDSSGNYFEAGCAGANCPDSGIPGRWNQALRFDSGVADDDGNDGTADYLTMPATDAALGFENGSFTIMAWVKPDAINGNRRILAAERTKSVNGVSFGVNGGNLILTNWGVKVYQSTQSAIPTGQWSHVAVSFDTNNDAHFYVNGQFVETVTGPAPPLVNTDDAYRIGATTRQSEATTAEPWDGLLDDLRILRFAANAGAVQAIMNEAPLLNLHLDEDIDTTTFVNDAPATASGTCNAAGATCPGAGDKGAMRESASFDGVDDRIEVADSDALDLDAFTIALWVKPTQKRSDYQAILTKESSKDDRNYGLFIHPDNLRLTYGMASNCANGVGQNSAGSLLQNQWNHVVTYDGGSQKRLYINGSVDGSVLAVTNPCHNNQPLQIGDGIQRYSGFAGNLDEITIEQGAVSAEQVAALYLYQSAWYDKKQQHTILVDADAPTVAVALNSEFIEPGQVLYIDAADPVVNGVASGLASVQYSIDGGAFVDAAVV
ncbi:MAG: LamG-like jellyroll fold domain-containing protein [Caldilineaceae bacterium]